MLRPNRGEGERPSFIKKGSQALLVTLIFATPLCMAQTALASTSSSFQKPSATSSIGGTQSLGLLGTQRTNQVRHLTTGLSNLGGKQSPFRLLTSDDISTLESTLTSYKSQLATLKATTPKNPANASSLNTAIKNVETKISDLEDAISKAKTAYAKQLDAQETLKRIISAYNSAVTAEEEARIKAETDAANYLVVQQTLQQTQATLDASLTRLNTALEAKNEAQRIYNLADASLTSQIQSTNEALTNLNAKKEAKSSAEQDLVLAQQRYNRAVDDLSLKSQTKEEALSLLQQAQSDYDTLLIPDPNWTVPTEEVQHVRQVPYTETVATTTLVPHTTQVPTTTLIPHTTLVATGGVLAEVFNRNGYNNAPPLPYAGETPIYTEVVSNINFNWGGGQVLNSGRSEDVIVRFTANLLVPEDGYYQFYSPADDGTKLNIAGMSVIDDWYDKGGGGTISDPVWIRAGIFYPFTLYYYENGGGASVSMYTYTPQQGFSLVPATWIGSGAQQITTYEEVTTWETVTTYEEVITYEEVTRYREEVYTTIEPVQFVEKTIQVAIDEGGSATFTAPEGSTFIYSNLRYEAKDRPECGVDIQPNVNNLSQVTIAADNGVWGDPCGGWYKHVVGTLTYKGVPTAPLINNPALIPAIQEAQVAYDAASSDYDLALSDKEDTESTLASNQSTVESATLESDSALSIYNTAIADQQTATQVKADAENNLSTATLEHTSASTLHETATNDFNVASTEEVTAKQVAETSTENHVTSQSLTKETLTSKNEAETELQTSESVTQLAYVKADAERKLVSFTEVETIVNEPAPPPVEEEGSKEIPAELSAENLMEVNLEAVDPTELTEAQAEQLVEAALETFETAEAGSAEYEQALDALYLAAEQDDIELSEELALIPGLAGAVEVLNFLGNAGADMSPQVREQSEKVVVTAVVAAGVAVQAAAGAATSAAVSAGASTGSSGGGSRRIGK